jgi:hypothetical protein
MLRVVFAELADKPLIVSPANALTTLLAPLAPLTPVALSAVATRDAASTPTEMVAVRQLVGFSASQI